jgi:hypothetical protein
MNKKIEEHELRGIAKILDCLWENSYNVRRMDKRIEKELVYFFGKNWVKDMYDFIGAKGCRREFPRTLKEMKDKN